MMTIDALRRTGVDDSLDALATVFFRAPPNVTPIGVCDCVVNGWWVVGATDDVRKCASQSLKYMGAI